LTGAGGPAFPPCPPPPGVGDPAPDFTLPWKIGEPPFRLHERLSQGPVVLFFYPLAFSPVCTDEICAVSDDLSAWGELNATVVGISVDSIWVNRRFARECGADFPLLSDFNREVCTAYGVRSDDYFGMKGVSKRAAFVVARDGTVAWSWVTEDDSVLPDLEAVRAALARSIL
jgi:glutaredoxin-dependent peroxiredoxin